MNKEQKAQAIEELAEKIAATPFFYVTDASGLSVAEVNNLRRKFYGGSLEYKVYKNTVIKKAMEKLDADFTPMYDALKGFSGIIFSAESGSSPAKILKEFRGKKGEKPVLKAAFIDSDIILGDQNLEMLSSLKSKNELIGEIIGLLQSPAKNVISSLQSGGSKLSGILQTLSERAE